MNKKDGTFEESLTSSMTSISSASMGADMADLNNDIYPEIFVTDMLPRDFKRYQTKTTFEAPAGSKKPMHTLQEHKIATRHFGMAGGKSSVTILACTRKIACVYTTMPWIPLF